MDSIENMRAVLATAKLRSFSRAARDLGVAPSVITKRVSQLEWAIRAQIFQRSTRNVVLTEHGERHLRRIAMVVAEHDRAMAAMRSAPEKLDGALRIKTPSTLGAYWLNGRLLEFQAMHPEIELEVLLMDGAVDPIGQGIDLAVTAFPDTFADVLDEPLGTLRRAAYASPAYLKRFGVPEHPRTLLNHACVVYQPTGDTWTFLGAGGQISVNVPHRLATNDGGMLLQAARDGSGCVLLSDYLAAEALSTGALVRILADFPVPDMSLKAVIPVARAGIARVQAALAFLKSEIARGF